MKKNNNKGFMMAELLVVAVVVLVIFTVLFTNFLPTKGEYEKRLEYNDIDTLYGNYYMRVLILRYFSSGTKTLPTLSNGYLKVVENNTCLSSFASFSYNNITCEQIVNKYGISDVVVTNYKPTNYNGPLKEYINYLDIEDFTEVYRVTTKTNKGYSSSKLYSKVCGEEQVTYGPWQISCSGEYESEEKKVRTYRQNSKPVDCDSNPLCEESSGSYILVTYPCGEDCSCDGLSDCNIGTQLLCRNKYVYKMEQELEEQNFSITPCN